MSKNTAEMRKIHQEAITGFDEVQSAVRDERMQCLEDRRFYSISGAQWEGTLRDQFENKPRFEVNKVHLAVLRIINEYRNNRITVDFVSKEGAEYDQLADTCDMLYRADEQDSSAEEAYDNAFEEAVGGGFGAWRLRSVYENEEDDEDERQRIRIEPIFDADSSVFFDLDAKRQDKADAKKAWVITGMSRDAYTEEYNDDPASWPKDISKMEFDWATPDTVYVAEYYKVEMVKDTVHVYQHLDGEEERFTSAELEDSSLIEELQAVGARKVREKKVNRRKVHKYIVSGGGVLEDCGYIAGKHIPIVPVYGKRWFVDNVERCMGHVRLAKDVQRLKNMQLSKLGEISAQSSVEKPILTPEQIANHTTMWSEDNVKNYPYLLINPITNANGEEIVSGPVAYTKSPNIPPAMAALFQITESDMQEILGNQQAGEMLQSNVSGKAVELVQNKIDMQAFIYMSNMAKAVKRSGEIWLSMAKDVLVEDGRKMKGIGSQGEKTTIELMRPVIGEDGDTEYENDLSEAEFDVAVDVGPSSSSKRASTVRALTGMLTMVQDPETALVISSMALMNMEGEGLTEVRDYFRKKLLSLGAVKPTEEELQSMQDAQAAADGQPDPQSQYLMAAAEEASAKAAKAHADTMLTIAKAAETNASTENKKAATLETLSTIDENERRLALEAANSLAAIMGGIKQRPAPAPAAGGMVSATPPTSFGPMQ